VTGIIQGISAGMIGCLLAGGLANASDLTLQHMNRNVWAAEQGAPGAIDAFAQSRDGTLWLGIAVGLLRFDGIRFEAYPASGDQPLPSPNISTLSAGRIEVELHYDPAEFRLRVRDDGRGIDPGRYRDRIAGSGGGRVQ